MGMDVYGRKPKGPTGRYFRANVWTWRPLAELSLHFAANACKPCKHWWTNDGDGLAAEASLELASVLESALKDSSIDRYLKERDAALAAIPDEACEYCHSTGKRHWPNHGTMTCNACDGHGKSRPLTTWYKLDRQKVEDWIAFLKECGGFSIN